MSKDDKVRQAAKNCIKNCMGTKSGEEVLIITDPPRLDLAELMRDEAKKLGATAEIILLPDPEVRKIQPLNTPSDILIGAVSRSDVILNFFENIALELRPFRTTLIEQAKTAGRLGHMIGAERSSFERGALLADCSEVARYSDILAMILSKGKSLTVRSGPSSKYTLTFGDLGGWHEIASSDSGILTEKHSYGNLPAGEAFIAISLSRSAHINGEICIDNFISEVGHIDHTKPVILTIVKGEVTDIKGPDTAEKLKKNLERAENAARDRSLEPEYVRKIAEIGIGTNPMAKIGESTIETEKRMGTLHIALGNNSTFGGTYEAPNHYDCVLSQLQLEIDDRVILEEGRIKPLNTLRRQFEENYDLMDKTRIEDESLVTKISSDVIVRGTKLCKKWTDFEGRTHYTQVGDNVTSQKAAKLWQCMDKQETLAKLLDKTDLADEVTYQLLRLLEQYLLVGIEKKATIDFVKQLRDQTESNFAQLSNALSGIVAAIKEDIYDQEKIYLADILQNIRLLRESFAATDTEGILERIKRIESNTDELLRSDSGILSSTLTVSAGIGPFLNISGQIDLKKLLTKIREKLAGIKKKLSSSPHSLLGH